MSDDEKLPREIERYWETLAKHPDGPVPETREIDQNLTETLRRLHAMARSPLPAGANGPVDRMIMAAIYPKAEQNGRESMELAHVLTHAVPRAATATLSQVSEKSRRQRKAALGTQLRRVPALLATAALFVMMFVGGYLVYRDQHAVVVPGTLASPVATATADASIWPVSNGANPQRTRSMAGPGPSGTVGILWTYPSAGDTALGSITDGLSGTYADGMLTLSAGNGLIAIDSTSGVEIWRTSEVTGMGVIDGDGLVLRGSTESGGGYDLVRINRTDASISWRSEIGQLHDNWSPMIADGIGYVPSGTSLIAFDPASGSRLWAVDLGAPATSGATVVNGLAVVGNELGVLFGISTSDHSVTWTLDTDAVVLEHPTLSDDTAYVALYGAQNTFIAVDLSDGALRWTFESPKAEQIFGGALSNERIFLSADDGSIYALNAATGELIWTFDSQSSGIANSTLVEETLYTVAADGNLRAINTSSGEELWQIPLGSSANFPPIVVDGVIYVGNLTGEVLAFGAVAADSTAVATPPLAAATVTTVDEATEAPSPVEFTWEISGGSEPFSNQIVEITVAPDGRLWVVDGEADVIHIFNPDGTFVETWGETGSGDGQFNFTRAESKGDAFGAVAFAPDGSFYVADEGNFRVQKFDKDRNFVLAWGGRGSEAGQFLSPIDVAIDPEGNVFVDDDYRNDVQKFSADGVYNTTLGGIGSGEGQLLFQGWMDVDSDGNVWVADPAHKRIVVFDNDGRFLANWDGDGSLTAPMDVVVDAKGRVFVTDADQHSILVLDSFGNVIATWGEYGTGQGQFTTPIGITLDGNGGVYVVDMDGPVTRVQKFRLLPPLGPE